MWFFVKFWGIQDFNVIYLELFKDDYYKTVELELCEEYIKE